MAASAAVLDVGNDVATGNDLVATDQIGDAVSVAVATGIFTAAKSGWFRPAFHGDLDSDSVSENATIGVYKNSDAAAVPYLQEVNFSATATADVMQVGAVFPPIYLKAGDTLTFNILGQDNQVLTFFRTHFYVEFIASKTFGS